MEQARHSTNAIQDSLFGSDDDDGPMNTPPLGLFCDKCGKKHNAGALAEAGDRCSCGEGTAGWTGSDKRLPDRISLQNSEDGANGDDDALRLASEPYPMSILQELLPSQHLGPTPPHTEGNRAHTHAHSLLADEPRSADEAPNEHDEAFIDNDEGDPQPGSDLAKQHLEGWCAHNGRRFQTPSPPAGAQAGYVGGYFQTAGKVSK